MILGLAPRVIQILDKYAEGKVTKEIAHELGLSYATVKQYIAQGKHENNFRTTHQMLAAYIEYRTIKKCIMHINTPHTQDTAA